MLCKVKKCENTPKLRTNGVHYVRCESCTFHHLCVVCGNWCPKFWGNECLERPFCYTCGRKTEIETQHYNLSCCLDIFKESWYSGRGYLLAMKKPSNGYNDKYTLFRGREMWEKRQLVI